MGALRPLQARPQPDHVRHPDSARPREATGRPPATRARQRAQTKRTERGHYPSRVLRRLAGGDDRGARRQAGVRRPLAMARLGRSASAKPQLCSRILLHLLRSPLGRYCCKSPKLSGDNFPAVRRFDRRPPIYVVSITLPRSPVSLSSGDEVPHIFTRKSRLKPGEFLITVQRDFCNNIGTKRTYRAKFAMSAFG